MTLDTIPSCWRYSAHVFCQERDLQILKILSTSPRSLVLLLVDSSGKESVAKVGPLDGTLKDEAACISELAHPNIIPIQDLFIFRNTIIIQMEKVDGISLVELLVSKGPLPEYEVKAIIKQLLRVTSYLHSNKWIHRDIKPDNLIYHQETGKIHLIDFEFACKYERGRRIHEKFGTHLYSSPEMRQKDYEGPETDIWSIGVTTYVLLTCHFPFNNNNNSSDEKLFIPPKLSLLGQDFLKLTLGRDTIQRSKTEDLLRHPWFETIEKRSKSPHIGINIINRAMLRTTSS